MKNSAVLAVLLIIVTIIATIGIMSIDRQDEDNPFRIYKIQYFNRVDSDVFPMLCNNGNFMHKGEAVSSVSCSFGKPFSKGGKRCRALTVFEDPRNGNAKELIVHLCVEYINKDEEQEDVLI